MDTDSTQAHLSPPLGDLAECITPVSMAGSILACCVVCHYSFKRLNSTYSFLFFIFPVPLCHPPFLSGFLLLCISFSFSLVFYTSVSPPCFPGGHSALPFSLSSLPSLPSPTPFPSHNKTPHISSVFLVCVSFTRRGLDSTGQGPSQFH